MAEPGATGPRIEVRRDDALMPHERTAVRAWTGTVFGPQPYVISPMEWRVMLWADGQLVSHVGIVRRTVDVGGQPIGVGGIGWVGTLEERRMGGLASRTMRRAQELMAELGVDFGLLVTGERTVPFYEKLGWGAVSGPLSFDQPAGKVTWPGVAMALPVPGRDWPGGPIDLRGLLW